MRSKSCRDAYKKSFEFSDVVVEVSSEKFITELEQSSSAHDQQEAGRQVKSKMELICNFKLDRCTGLVGRTSIGL